MIGRLCRPVRLMRWRVRSLCTSETYSSDPYCAPDDSDEDSNSTHLYHKISIPSAELNEESLSSISKQILAHTDVSEINTNLFMNFLRETLPQMNLEEISVLLLAAGKRRYVLNLEITTYITNYLASNTEIPKAQTVTQLVSGLQNRNSRFGHVNRLIEVIASKVDACPFTLSAAQIGYCFAGTRSLWSVVPEVRRLSAALNRKFYNCDELFTASSLSHIIFGLQNKTIVDPQVRKTLFFVVEKLKSSSTIAPGHSFTSPALAHFIYGLGSIRDDIYEMRKLLSVMAEVLPMLPVNMFSGINMESMIGLQSFRGNAVESKQFINALAPLVLHFNRPIHNNQVVRALMGFRCMGDAIDVNEKMIRHLLQFMANSPARFSNSDLLQVMTILRYINDETLVREILTVLVDKASTATGHITPQVFQSGAEKVSAKYFKMIPEYANLVEHFRSVIASDGDKGTKKKRKNRNIYDEFM